MKHWVASLYLMLIGFLVTGCAPWVKVENPLVKGPGNAFEVKLPVGWMRAQVVSNRVFITRDGAGIQFIEIMKRAHEKAFPRIKEKTRTDMLPSEVAEFVVAEIKSNEGLSGLKVLTNVPATVAQKTGFRLHLQMSTESALRYEIVVYGFVDESGFYQLAFQAPTLYYFQRDLLVFERVVKSFRLIGKTA